MRPNLGVHMDAQDHGAPVTPTRWASGCAPHGSHPKQAIRKLDERPFRAYKLQRACMRGDHNPRRSLVSLFWCQEGWSTKGEDVWHVFTSIAETFQAK